MRIPILGKMILAFLIVSIITVALLIAGASYKTGMEFNTYLAEKDQETTLNHFYKYYEKNSSWDGVAATMPDLFQSLSEQSGNMDRPSFILADMNDIVLISGGYYKTGDLLLQNDKRISKPLIVDETTVGYIIFRQPAPGPIPGPEGFIKRVNNSLLIFGVLALVFALILGVIISRIFTRPLRELTAAAREVSNGNLDQHVNVRSRDELGELTVVFNDMTSKLSRLIESRKQMTADVAHELRTPISVILGHAEAIHDGVLEPNPEIIEIIRQESIRLEKIVNDLRVLALSDAGELVLAPAPFSPNTLMKSVFDLFKYRAQSKGIHLKVDCAPDLPEVLIDHDRMIQVFSNLIENALRVTPAQGSISLSANSSDHQVEFIVTDTGPGIREEDLDKVFDRLFRTDQSRKRDHGGSGLGLTIARSIVEQHGGKIWAE